MQTQPTMRCGECRQPILSGEQCVCFKVPGTAGYQFFHCRYRYADCWEGILSRSTNALAIGNSPEAHNFRDR